MNMCGHVPCESCVDTFDQTRTGGSLSVKKKREQSCVNNVRTRAM